MGGAYILQTLGPRGWSVETAGQLVGGLGGGLRGSLWRRRARAGRWPGPWPRGANGSRVRAQTQADAGIRILPAVCSFFFFFKKTTASAVREKPHLPADCNRAVLQLD